MVGRISQAMGGALIRHGDGPWMDAMAGDYVLPTDSIQVGDGVCQVSLANGNTLGIERDSQIAVYEPGQSRNRIELRGGRIACDSRGLGDEIRMRFVVVSPRPMTRMRLESAGERASYLAVLNGAAEAFIEEGEVRSRYPREKLYGFTIQAPGPGFVFPCSAGRSSLPFRGSLRRRQTDRGVDQIGRAIKPMAGFGEPIDGGTIACLSYLFTA